MTKKLSEMTVQEMESAIALLPAPAHDKRDASTNWRWTTDENGYCWFEYHDALLAAQERRKNEERKVQLATPEGAAKRAAEMKRIEEFNRIFAANEKDDWE